MFIILLPLSWFLVFTNLLSFNKKKQLNYNFGELILYTAIGWTLILVFLTEFLSLFNALNQFWITISWVGVSGVLMANYLKGKYRLVPTKARDLNKKIIDWFSELDWFYRVLAVSTIAIVLVTFILGLIFPPNGADALSYHLPRVMHWIQNQSVVFYPTHIVRQNIIQPGAEYIALHILVLSNNNSFVHLIQWSSMIGSLIAVFLITGLLGGGKRAQILVVAFSVTLPIGFLESNSAQNDYVATFWLVTFIYFLLKGLKTEKQPFILLSAFALGLAILTKVTNYFYGFSFLLFFLWPTEKKEWKKIIINGLIIALIVLLINSGFLLRTFALYGKPIGDTSFFKITNNYYSPSMTLTNVVVELLNQLQTPFHILNIITKSVFVFFLTFILMIDPKVNVQNLDSFLNNISMPSEDIAVNTFHVIFIFLSIFFGTQFFKRRSIINKYFGSIILSVVIISTLFVWTQFNTRYFLNLYIALSPIIGIIAEKYINKLLIQIFFIVFFLTSVLYLILNINKPIAMVFEKNKEYYQSQYLDSNYVIAYRQLANIIIKNKYKKIGLNIEELFSEYPLWIYLKNQGVNDFRIEHVDVRNQTRKIILKNFEQDVIIMCDYCFKDVAKYNEIYSKWAKVKYKVPIVPYFTLYENASFSLDKNKKL